MDTDRLKGTAKEIGGKVQAGAGDLMGDSKTELDGRMRQAEGATQNVVGQAKDAFRSAAQTASDFAGDAYDKSGDYVGRAKEAARQVAGSAQDYASGAYDSSGRYINQAQDTVRGAASSVSDYAQDAYNNPGRYVRQGTDVVGRQVEENPMLALLVAGAIGYGLATLIHGRR